MDCRNFHQKLEDYLEGGLDFSGRFGMERHAQQCLSCGKELADAQQLKRMASDLQRVKAPVNFETSLLREIASHKSHGRFWSVRKYWIYGFEWPSWRRMTVAASGLAVLSLGIFFALHRPEIESVSNSPVATVRAAKAISQATEAESTQAPKVDALLPKKEPVAEVAKAAKKAPPSARAEDTEVSLTENAPDMDYVEYLMPGPDNYAVPVRLPKKIPMRYGQMSEEYFIRNVSH